MKLIGLDVGERRIGVAFGDSALRVATPVDVIERVSPEHAARAIAAFVRDYDAARVIVGLPRNMDGTLGPQAVATQTFVEQIAAAIPGPIQFWDERLTTEEAVRQSHATGARGKKSRRHQDALAAAVILQDYMDDQTNQTDQPIA